MIIYPEDTEEVRIEKRRENEKEMAETHYLGSLCLPFGVPIGCKVEQPRERHRPDYDGIQSDTSWTNGQIRVRHLNGNNRYEYRMGFAGRARPEEKMNWGEPHPLHKETGNPNK